MPDWLYSSAELSQLMHDKPIINIKITRNSSVDEIGKRYHLNNAIIVQAACQTVLCRTMCLQAAYSWNTPQLMS